jgi:hypothetical protein
MWDIKEADMGYARFSVLFVVVLMAGCSGVTSRVRQGRVPATLDQKPDRHGYIEAIGIGASDPTLPTETQRKSLARDAAIVKAQYELLSMVKGVELEGGLRVDRALEKDSSIETRLKETIRGAEVLKSEFTSDNGCVVTLRLSKRKLAKLMGVSL